MAAHLFQASICQSREALQTQRVGVSPSSSIHPRFNLRNLSHVSQQALTSRHPIPGASNKVLSGTMSALESSSKDASVLKQYPARALPQPPLSAISTSFCIKPCHRCMHVSCCPTQEVLHLWRGLLSLFQNSTPFTSIVTPALSRVHSRYLSQPHLGCAWKFKTFCVCPPSFSSQRISIISTHFVWSTHPAVTCGPLHQRERSSGPVSVHSHLLLRTHSIPNRVLPPLVLRSHKQTTQRTLFQASGTSHTTCVSSASAAMKISNQCASTSVAHMSTAIKTAPPFAHRASPSIPRKEFQRQMLS